MEQEFVDLAIAIVTMVIGAVIGWFKRTGIDIKFEDKMSKYVMYFEVVGTVIKAIDEKLYIELEQAITEMKMAYSSTQFTPDAFNACVKECEDVVNRIKTVLGNR